MASGQFWHSGFWAAGFWAPGFWAATAVVPPAPGPSPGPSPAPVIVVAAPTPPAPALPITIGNAEGGGGGGLPSDMLRLFTQPDENELDEPQPKAEPPPVPVSSELKKSTELELSEIGKVVLPTPPSPIPGWRAPELPPSVGKPRILTRSTPAPLSPPKRRPVIVVTEQWGGSGLALLMQQQGSDVICAYDYREVEPKDRECTQLIGNGLVNKMPLKKAMGSLRDEEAIWVFDANDFPKEADWLRSRGEQVIGTSVIAQKLEEDRQFAVEVAQQVGFAIPESEEFTDYGQGLQFLQANSDRAWCYKPDAQDPTATYVPMEKDDPAKANQELQEYLSTLKNGGQPRFMLQEVVNGVEVNFEMWVSQGQPLVAFCDLEAKRKLVGDLGENVGCAGDYVFRVPLDTLGVVETVSKYLSHPRLRSYTGSIDANVMVVDGKPYFLENCFRFGYNAYPVIFQELANERMEDILRGWVGGKDLTQAFREGVGGSLSVVVDHPKRETPLIIPPGIVGHVYLYRGYWDDGLKIVEGWSEIACVTGLAPNLPEAGQQCLDRIKQIGVPDKGYRVDLTSGDLPTLPIARYEALVQMGWIPEQDELMAAAKAFLATMEVV